MHVEISFRNYRCFGDQPTSIELKNGITAVVGPNNSGKSTLLRSFYEFRPFFQSLLNVHNLSVAIKGGLDFPHPREVKDVQQLFHKANDRDLVMSIRELDRGKPEPITTVSIDRNSRKVSVTLSELANPELDRIGILNGNLLGYQRPRAEPLVDLTPILRLFEALTKTVYIGPFRGIAEQGATGDYYDLKVGNHFVQIWNAMKTGDNARHADIALAVRREIQKLFKFAEFEISGTQDQQSLQVVVNNGSFKINELGSGLSQFIITFAHAAIAKPKYILIDEPESNLHASMQLSFVLSLASFAECGLLFSTHSLGLARSAADQILAVQRISDDASRVTRFEEVERLSQLVGELNFSAYQQIGFSVVLLVEGVTEVKTVQQFLRKLKVEQKVLLVPLFGTSMINEKREYELEELKRITPRIFALIDSEKTTEQSALPKARQGFKAVCDKLGIVCHILTRRSLENYFSVAAIQSVYGATMNGLQPYDDVKAVNGWSKADNWKVAQQMNLDDLAKSDLLLFLEGVAAESQKSE